MAHLEWFMWLHWLEDRSQRRMIYGSFGAFLWQHAVAHRDIEREWKWCIKWHCNGRKPETSSLLIGWGHVCHPSIYPLIHHLIHPSIHPLIQPSGDSRSELEQLTVLWPCSTWWRILTKWRTRCWQCVCSRAPSPRTAIYFEREGGKRWSWRTRGKRKSLSESTIRNANLFSDPHRLLISIGTNYF